MKTNIQDKLQGKLRDTQRDCRDETRREFVKNSAKLSAGVALFGGAIFSSAQAQSTASATSASQIIGSNEAIAQAKSGARIQSKGYAAFSKDFKFKPHSFTRHPLGANDILIEILYAGICHSDLHAVLGEHGKPNYPMIPGHEIAGRVIAVGAKVRKFKIGDYAGIFWHCRSF